MDQATADKLTDVILEILSKQPNGEMAFSDLKTLLTGKGLNGSGRPGGRWTGLGNAGEFQDTLETLGFELRRVYTKNTRCIRATYVHV